MKIVMKLAVDAASSPKINKCQQHPGTCWCGILDTPGAISLDTYRVGDAVDEANFIVRQAEARDPNPCRCDACGGDCRELGTSQGWLWLQLSETEAVRWFRLCEPCSLRVQAEDTDELPRAYLLKRMWPKGELWLDTPFMGNALARHLLGSH